MLADRAIAEELMDADDLDPADYAAVLQDLAKVNTLTMARRPTLSFLNRLPRERLRILDVGFGDGDMLRAIARWARRRAQSVELVGIDLNPRSAAVARRATPTDLTIEYLTGDYFGLCDREWDVVISSLVAHHMSRPQLVAFVRFMEANAAMGWFVNDLHRHGLGYFGFPILARLMRWHPIVRHDGQLSIARSYRPREWEPLLQAAGVRNAEVRRVFPLRLCVSRIH